MTNEEFSKQLGDISQHTPPEMQQGALTNLWLERIYDEMAAPRLAAVEREEMYERIRKKTEMKNE